MELGHLAVAAREMRRSATRPPRVRARFVTGQGGDEPVAAPVGGADERLATAVVPDGSACCLDAARHRRLADEAVAPDVVEELVLADDPLPVLDEVGEHIEDLWLQGHADARAT